MATVRELIDTLMQAAISRGEVEPAAVAAAAKRLVCDCNLKPDELLPLFEVLPRAELQGEVFQSLLAKFFDAEKQLGRTDASRSLIMSDFAGCVVPAKGQAFVQLASTALSRIEFKDGPAHEDICGAVLKWSLVVLQEAAAAGLKDLVAARATAIIAMTLKRSSFFFFAPVVDALRAVKAHLVPATNAVVEGLLEAVLVQAGGMAAFDEFQKKSGADLKALCDAAGIPVDLVSLQRKARMISTSKILSAPANKGRFAIGDVAAALGLNKATDVDLAENIVLDAATADLVSVQIDRAAATVIVMDTAVLRFDPAAWQGLKKRVDDLVAVTDRLATAYALPAV